MSLKIIGASNHAPKYATLSKGFPAWIQALDKAPKSSAVFGAIGVVFTASFFVWAVMGARGNYLLTHSLVAEFVIDSLI